MKEISWVIIKSKGKFKGIIFEDAKKGMTAEAKTKDVLITNLKYLTELLCGENNNVKILEV